MARLKSLLAVLTCGLVASGNVVQASDNRSMQAPSITPFQVQNTATPRPPFVEKYLVEGTLQSGEMAARARLDECPRDDQLRFGLGMLQFISAIEGLVQDLYRYGLRTEYGGEFNLPFPKNPHPTALTYDLCRQSVEDFRSRLEQAERTLAGITDTDVKLPIHFGLIKLNFDDEPQSASKPESLWKLYAQLARARQVTEVASERFYITFDRGDVHWLRGYCHLVMAVCDSILAYDCKETFDHTAHLFFERTDTPYAFLRRHDSGHKLLDHELDDIFDLVALIHLIKWQVREPARMESALHHLEAVVAQSRLTWKSIMAESDDDHEWLPNPEQSGALPNMNVTKEMVVSWNQMMDDVDRMLAGKLLIPFWRGGERRGLNLRKVFLQPREFDLVLWFQGSAAAPYLENGPTANTRRWGHNMNAFEHNFPGFALWFN